MSIYAIVVFLLTYLVCSINPAIEVCKKKTGQDIRKLGSGNAGSANAMRVLGKPLGTLVVLLDIAKVFLSYFACILIGKLFNQPIDVSMKSMFIVASIFGHCFPIYYNFKGGKGVIVGITVAVILNKQIALICLAIGVVVIIITKVVSIGTLVGLIAYIGLTIFQMSEYLIPIIIISVIVLYKHRANIQRILTKQEEKIR